MFALPFFMPRLNSSISLSKKIQNVRAEGAPPPDHQNSPTLRISGYAPVSLSSYQDLNTSQRLIFQSYAVLT